MLTFETHEHGHGAKINCIKAIKKIIGVNPY
jgi:hypothetical protein